MNFQLFVVARAFAPARGATCIGALHSVLKTTSKFGQDYSLRCIQCGPATFIQSHPKVSCFSKLFEATLPVWALKFVAILIDGVFSRVIEEFCLNTSLGRYFHNSVCSKSSDYFGENAVHVLGNTCW